MLGFILSGVIMSSAMAAHPQGALTRAAKSFLKAQSFPTVFNDASFSTRMQVLAQGYEPWETEYDSSGRCISGCAYSTMDIDEDLRQMQQQTQHAVTELQQLGYLPTQPVQTQPVQTQPVQVQPVIPPVQTQPVHTQPVQTPPVQVQPVTPPVQTPPVVTPPAQTQPIRCNPHQSAIPADQDVPLGEPVTGRPPITSPFGRRTHPVTGNQQNHSGVDLGVPRGTNVFSPASGKVVSVWTDSTCGNGIKISHSRGYETVYCHLDKQIVRSGERVQAGCLIGKSGNTGRSTGPHLHYAIKKDGTYIDPEKLMRR